MISNKIYLQFVCSNMKFILISLFLLLSLGIGAQIIDRDEYYDGTEDEEENFVDPDSVDYESYTKKTSSFKALFNGKPGKAIMYGLLIPGGGQMYNKRYWKVPIALALEAGAITTFIVVRGEYNNLNEGYQLVLDGEAINYKGLTTAEQFFNTRKRWRKFSEQAGIGMLVVHIIISVEAYIDRHLIDFDISEDLSFQLKPIDI